MSYFRKDSIMIYSKIIINGDEQLVSEAIQYLLDNYPDMDFEEQKLFNELSFYDNSFAEDEIEKFVENFQDLIIEIEQVTIDAKNKIHKKYVYKNGENILFQKG